MTIAEKLARAKTDLYDAYNNGHYIGYNEGFSQGVDIGKNEQWNEFWDNYQDNGDRSNYNNAFSGKGWHNKTFKPKYNVAGTTHNGAFTNSNISGDLVEMLNNRGLNLDTSQSTSVYAMFNSAYYITRVGVIDTRNCVNLSYTFQYTSTLKTIDKIILKDDGSQTYSATFTGANKLQNITFEGVIGQTINFQSCPLTLESAKSVINHLKNYSGTSNELAYTVTFSDTTKGYLEADGQNSPNGTTWYEYITYLGWKY